MDRKKLEQDWLDLKKQQRQIQLKMQLLEYAMICEEDEMAELFTGTDIRVGGCDINGAVLALGKDDDVYLFEVVDGYIPKLRLKEKVTKDKYVELEKEATK